MIGNAIKRMLNSRDMTVSELSKLTGIPSTTLYSMIKRNNSTVGLPDLLLICHALHIPPEFFFNELGLPFTIPALPSDDEWELISRWRLLDKHGRNMVDIVITAELDRLEQKKTEEELSVDFKVIPLFFTPTAAGAASPKLDEDYEDYLVPASSNADFATRISDGCMEPYIKDGSVILITRSLALNSGDIGLFCVNNEMLCKQYFGDESGNIRLTSLNRKCSNADIEISSASGQSIFCYGKVLLDGILLHPPA